ncbi:MAG TPA: ACT domain-containing protein [Candidatus Omnitrophota bacterium]|nr:ACT domain-containing protein [Candidatus Omnitrophota bacterium]HPS37618.1 ACT domain-containing protein [Candidatus Omnitrophota bacterium]
MKKILLTVSGQDKPGIIAKVSGVLFARGCNLEDVSMTLLEGQFAMMMTACLPSRVPVEAVRQAVDLLENSPWSMDCHITELKGKTPRGRKQAKGAFLYMVSAFGKDRTGIVYEISRALAGLRINITDLDSRILGKGVKTTYAMLLEVELPGKAALVKLQKTLSRVAAKLKIEIQLKPLERVSF